MLKTIIVVLCSGVISGFFGGVGFYILSNKIQKQMNECEYCKQMENITEEELKTEFAKFRNKE